MENKKRFEKKTLKKKSQRKSKKNNRKYNLKKITGGDAVQQINNTLIRFGFFSDHANIPTNITGNQNIHESAINTLFEKDIANQIVEEFVHANLNTLLVDDRFQRCILSNYLYVVNPNHHIDRETTFLDLVDDQQGEDLENLENSIFHVGLPPRLGV